MIPIRRNTPAMVGSHFSVSATKTPIQLSTSTGAVTKINAKNTIYLLPLCFSGFRIFVRFRFCDGFFDFLQQIFPAIPVFGPAPAP